MSREKVGIVVSGGPAPGINSAVASCVFELVDHGFAAVGLVDGFRGVSTLGSKMLRELEARDVTASMNRGGSIIGTSRFNPFMDEECTARFIETMKQQKIGRLIVIGGEGSAYLTLKLAEHFPELQTVHLPKTIDNDLPLPSNQPSFGFETARYAGAKIISTFCADAKTTNRWFVVRCMGRRAGFLTLGLGMGSGATLSLIPEEFSDRQIVPEDLAQIIFSSLKRRRQEGKRYGVALMAEGLMDRIDLSKTSELSDCPRDEMGRIRYAEVELEELVAQRLRKLCKAEGIHCKTTTENIGYELRCHDPISYDIEYTRFLGHGAIKYLMDGLSCVMVVKDFDYLKAIPLQSLTCEDGVIRSRSVDLDSELYKVARSFMIRDD